MEPAPAGSPGRGQRVPPEDREDGDRERRRRNRERPRDEGEEEEGAPGGDDEPGGGERENKEGGDGAEQAREEIEKLLRESLRRGDLDLDEKQLEQLGGMAELERVLRELAEEAGLAAPEEIIPLFVFEHTSGFRYYNFLVTVAAEFEPNINWETQGFEWFVFGDWPEPAHFGLIALLSDTASHAILQNYAQKAR